MTTSELTITRRRTACEARKVNCGDRRGVLRIAMELGDVLLLLIGVVVGYVGKFVIDPLYDRWIARRKIREDWLKQALEHARKSLKEIQRIRTEYTLAGGLSDPEELSRSIVMAIDDTIGPSGLQLGSHVEDRDLARAIEGCNESYRHLKIAQLDIQHKAKPSSEEYEPYYVLQWYTTQLANFQTAAESILTGRKR